MNLLLPLIVFIGTHTDLHSAKLIAKELHAKAATIEDRKSLSRFPRSTGAYYRSIWGGRVNRLQIGFPDITVVFARETVSGRWKSGCVNWQTVLCRADDVAGCVAVVRDTWCRK